MWSFFFLHISFLEGGVLCRACRKVVDTLAKVLRRHLEWDIWFAVQHKRDVCVYFCECVCVSLCVLVLCMCVFVCVALGVRVKTDIWEHCWGGWVRSQVLHADLAAADAREQLITLERLAARRAVELLLHGREPEAILVGEVVARALGAVALNEGRAAEVLKARARWHQKLAATLLARSRVLWGDGEEKRVTLTDAHTSAYGVRQHTGHAKSCYSSLCVFVLKVCEFLVESINIDQQKATECEEINLTM